MERLDRIEARIDELREDLRALLLAQAIANRETRNALIEVRETLEQLDRQLRPPRLRLWLAILVALLSLGVGATAHWRISRTEEVNHVQLVLPPRTPLQNLQQSAAGRD